MNVMERIVFTDGSASVRVGGMMITDTTLSARRTHAAPEAAWIQWRTDLPEEPERLTVAELAECHCPDLCDRDHANE